MFHLRQTHPNFMIRHWIVLGILAASPILGQVGSTALYLDFEHSPSTPVLQAMQAEVDGLLGPDGLHFVWQFLPETESKAWLDLAVVRLSGTCAMLPFATNMEPDSRLGWTHVSDGVVVPFAEIDCDAIRSFLLRDLLQTKPKSRDTVYGRAIGRVVAHELLHIFTRTTAHSDHGVDHPTLTRAELMADRLDLIEREPGIHIVRPNSTPVQGTAAAGKSTYNNAGCVTCHGSGGQGGAYAPKLRVAGRSLTSSGLAALLVKYGAGMVKKAHRVNVAAPALDEDEIAGLAYYLSDTNQ